MKLAFVTAPQTLSVNACSSPLIVESRDAFDMMRTVSSDTLINLSAPLGVTFFSDSGCNNSQLFVTLPTGSSRVTLYFRATTAGTPTLTAASLGLTSAMQTQTIVAPPDGLTLTVSGGTQVLAGSCLPATVTATASGNPVSVPTDTNVALSVSPLGNARFFNDPACAAGPVTSVNLPRGSSSHDFFVKPITGGNSTVTAAAPFGLASRPLRVTGAVHRGSCSMSPLATSVNCSIASPALTDLTHSLLVFQATVQNSNEVLAAEVRCRLAQTDTIACTRQLSQGTVTIQWQVLELVSGLSVQRYTGAACPTALPLIAGALDASRTVSLSHVTGTGTNFDGDDMTTTRLVDGGVAFDFAGQACSGYDLQLAEFAPPVSVLRGSSAGFATNSRLVNVVGLSAAPSATSVLFAGTNMVGGSAPNSASMCHFFTRGEIDTSTSLRFTRGSTLVNGCDNYATGSIVWQRVDFGTRARVQPQLVSMPMNTDTTTVSFTTVDMTRTLVFPSGVMASGLATGETAWDNTGNDEITDVVASFELINATQVRLNRADTFTNALFTVYVVEFEP